MVKIVDEGPDPSVVKRVICGGCGVTMEYVPNEINSRRYREIDGGYDTYCWIVCPKCGKDVTVRSY